MEKKPLPKVRTLQYDTTLPVTKKKILYRGYNVADERALIAAMDAKVDDPKFYAENMLGVIESAVLNDVNVRKLPSADVRYLLLQLRSKSVGETIELTYEKNPFTIHIDKIFVSSERVDDDYKIQVDENLFILMKELTFEDEIYAAIETTENNKGSIIYKLLIASVDSIYTNEDVWKVGEDISVKELEDFLGDIPSNISSKLYDFIKNMPVLAVEVELTPGEKRVLTNREVDFLASASPTST